MKNNKRYFISFTVILSIVMFSFISSVAVFASENIFTDGTELDIFENKKTNLYNVDNTANENDFISEIEESEMSKTVLNEENIDPNEYYGAAEPPVRCGESHLSGLTEPPHFVY